jgi:three-Cys-motif partner protein
MGQKKLPIIWSIENHTLAKHEILKEYLNAWFPILGRTSNRIVFLDGFAGPGIYKDGEEGSPIIAIRTALEHPTINQISEIRFMFIESDKQRSEILQQTIEQKFPKLPSNVYVQVITGDFVQNLCSTLDTIEENGKNLAPTLAFLDPFGYSEIPFKLITRLMNYQRCELFLTFMSGFVNRFLDESHEKAIDELYGTQEWRDARNIEDTNERLNFLLDLYVTQLENIGIQFVRPFTMRTTSQRIIYDLVFATKHWKGMDAMKKAMLKVVSNGTYTFSDKIDTKQTYFVDYSDKSHWLSDASRLVFTRFCGQKVQLEEIRDFVLAKTPFRFLKEILTHIEKNGNITKVSGRVKKTLSYADNCTIEFTKC